MDRNETEPTEVLNEENTKNKIQNKSAKKKKKNNNKNKKK